MKSNEICHVTTTAFHDTIACETASFDKHSYWLFTSKLCPFAHRTEIVRGLLKLTNIIGLTIADSIQTEHGWNLTDRYPSTDSKPCPIEDIDYLPELYAHASSGYTGRASVPVLFNTQKQSIINNESAEIIIQLNDLAVYHLACPSLYPYEKRHTIKQHIQQLEDEFITPIYKAGFAKNQADYHQHTQQVFTYLDKLNHHLSTSHYYFMGDYLTLFDVHAFCHLARFDSVYHSLYHLNVKYLSQYPHIHTYMKRLSAIPAFSNTLDIQALKTGYFLSWNQPTHGHYIPEGPPIDPQSGLAILA